MEPPVVGRICLGGVGGGKEEDFVKRLGDGD